MVKSPLKPKLSFKYSYLRIKGRFFGVPTPIYLNFLKCIKLIKSLIPKSIYFDGWESPAFIFSIIYSKIILRKLVLIGYRGNLFSHNYNNFLIKKLRRIIFGLADYIVTVGELSTDDVISLGVAPSKVVELFNPVDVSLFHVVSLSNRTVDLDSGHRFIFVGQLIPRKNVDSLLQAFSMISNPNDSLTIAGEGILESELQELSRKLGILNQVKFLGFQSPDEMPLIYSNIDTLVLPSTQEVWGLVANEALAAGAHVVVSQVAGVSASIRDMQGVYLCNPDKESIAAAMQLSRAQFNGPIASPEILKFTPEKFAQSLIEVINREV